MATVLSGDQLDIVGLVTCILEIVSVSILKQPLVRMVEEAGLDTMRVDDLFPLPGIKP
jgi:hypothetical protein